MQREWTDPRDGQVWLVTLNPFGASRGAGLAGRPGSVALVFHRPGRPPSWTEYGLSGALPEVGDQALMDLLDAPKPPAPWRDRAACGRAYSRRHPARSGCTVAPGPWDARTGGVPSDAGGPGPGLRG